MVAVVVVVVVVIAVAEGEFYLLRRFRSASLRYSVITGGRKGSGNGSFVRQREW